MRRTQLAALLAALLLVYGAEFLAWRELRGFDSARWQGGADTACGGHRRWWMVDDLRDEHLERGMTTTEIRDLLGPPDDDLVDHGEYDGYWVYAVGPDGFVFYIDCNFFALRFVDGRYVGSE